MKFTNAKVGEMVYSLRFGGGKITEINQDKTFPIVAFFDCGTREFNFSGLYIETDKNPDLYWSKPEIIEPKRPIEKVIEGFVNWYGEDDYKFHPTEDQAIRSANVIKNFQTVPCKLTFTITE